MNTTPQDVGFPHPVPPASTVEVPGSGRYSTPHYVDFGAVFNLATKTYRHTFDEALRQSPSNALAMRRDPVLMDALRARMMPTAQLSWHLEPRDPSDPRQLDAVKVLTSVIEDVPRFQQFRLHLLEALWYGRYAVECVYEWDHSRENPFTGGRRMTVRDYHPLNGDKLRFRFDGTFGVLVHAGVFASEDPERRTRVHPTDFGLAYFPDATERQQYVVHVHEPEDADFYEGELAGRIKGVGVRDRLYWFWYLKSQVLALMLTYVERFANGFTVYYYDGSNPAAKAEMLKAVEEQAGNAAILVPRYAAGGSLNGVERHEVSTATPSLLQALVTDYFDSVCRRFILGQTLSSETAPTGMGSGVAEAHGDTLQRIIKYDAENLDGTLTEWVKVLARYNTPNVPPPRFRSEIDVPNAAEVLSNAKILVDMGLPVDSDHLYGVTGIPRGAAGDTVVSDVGAMQPTALSTPQGVPVIGQPGPVPQQSAAVPADGGVVAAGGVPAAPPPQPAA